MSKPDLIHQGLTWRDMPGKSDFDKHCNFSLFRLGKLSLAYVTGTQVERSSMAGCGTCKGFAKGRAIKAGKAAKITTTAAP